MAAVDGFAVPAGILRHFDLANTPYEDESVVEQVGRQRRAFPDQKLFLDRLLELIELDGHSLYPPASPAAFRRLLHSVQASTSADRLKKDCFFYYLLRDADAQPRPRTEPSEDTEMNEQRQMSEDRHGESSKHRIEGGSKAAGFARRRCLPRMWTVFIDGYWALDHGRWDDAVACLSDPAIIQLDFISEILNTFATQVSPPSAALDLIHSFLQATHYLPTTPHDTEIHLLALASYSVPAAFAFIRSFDVLEMRTRLREAVWCWALGSPRGPCGRGKHAVQQRAMKEILHLPLLPEEDAHLVHFLSHPPKTLPSGRLSLLHDLVTLRLVHSGQYAESLQLDRDLAGSAAGSEDDRQRRREMVREFIAILPEAQRRALRTEGVMAAGQREHDSQDMATTFVPEEEMVVDAVEGEVDDDEGRPVDVMEDAQRTLPTYGSFVSTYVSSSASLNRADSAGSIAAPTPQLPTTPARVASPFGGPPRFASSSGLAGSLAGDSASRRILSGSPFNIPPSAAKRSTAAAPKQPKEILDDDDVVARRRSSRTRRAPSLAPTEPESMRDADEEAMPPPPVPTNRKAPATKQSNGRQAQREASVASEASIAVHEQDTEVEEEEAASQAKRAAPANKPRREPSPKKRPAPKNDAAPARPASPPAASTRQSARRRQSTAPSQMRNASKAKEDADEPDNAVMPGSFELSRSAIEASPARSTRQASAAPSDVTEHRRRITRSASHALLDEDEPERSSKKPRNATQRQRSRAPSAQPSAAGATPRRSTRRGTAQPSEAGSPTPSMVSVATSTRSTRGASARAESVTPRATRSRR